MCDVPLKDTQYYLLYISSANTIPRCDNIEDYYGQISKVEKEVKEVCPECKKILDEIFKLRKGKLNELSEELLGIYKTPTKQPPHGDRRQDKKKKKKK